MTAAATPPPAPAHPQQGRKLRIAVVGAGYWGPNLARNLQASPDWDLVAICDLDLCSGPETRRDTRRDPRGGEPGRVAGHVRRGRRGHRDAGAHPLRDRYDGAARRQARPGRKAPRGQPGARAGNGGDRGGERPGADGRPHVLLHTCRPEDAGTGAERLPRRHPVRGLHTHQPGTRPAGRGRVLGPCAARPVHPGLHPAGRAEPQ